MTKKSMKKKGAFELDHSLDHVMNRFNGDSDSCSIDSYGKADNEPIIDISDQLETPEEKKLRKRSHMVAYTTMFVMSIGFSIVLSGVWPYLTELDSNVTMTALGWVVAANPFGQMIASPLLGLWGNKAGSIRGACLTTIVCFIGGNMMYACLHVFDNSGPGVSYYMMILSRFIVGVSSANVALCRSYLAGSTTLKERTTGIAVIAAAQALGFVVGPAIQAVLTVVVKEPSYSGIPGVVWDKYTSAGWVAAILGFINLVIMMPYFFKEFYIAEKEHKIMSETNQESESLDLPKPNYWGVAASCISFGLVIYVTSLRETIATPLVTDQYGISNEKGVFYVSMALTSGGFLSVFIFLGTAKLTKILDERFVMIVFGFIPVIIGTFAHYPIGTTQIHMADCSIMTTDSITTTESTFRNSYNNWENLGYSEPMTTPGLTDIPEEECYGCPMYQEWCLTTYAMPPWQLITTFFIGVLGYPVAMSLTQTVFSKILGPTPQGLWMGLLTMSGSLARVTGPLWISNLYKVGGTIPTYMVLGCLETLATIILLVSYKNLVPMAVNSNKGKNVASRIAEKAV